VLGTVLNYSLAHPAAGPAVSSEQFRDLLEGTDSLAVVSDTVRGALGQSLHITFLGIFAIAVLTLVLALFVPRVTLTEGPREMVVE
jgi:hypothetical protein